MTKNLRHCLRFFSYILKQRETDIVYRAQNHSFYVQFSHSPLQIGLTHGIIVMCLIIITKGKKFHDTEQKISIT